jgi:flagellin
MSLIVNDNISSLVARDALNRTSSALSTSLERLSTGLKINSGADGPAALVISEQQQAQISGLQAAIQNTQTATSAVQTTEGALAEVNDLLTQIRSLAVDSANSGVQDANSLAANQEQVSNALATIDRIAANTQFGTKKVLDGSAGFNGTTDTPGISFERATDNASTGSFALNITTAAQRANTESGTAQTGNLAANENLTINGVAISLSAGQTQSQVVSTINQYSGQTGVTAAIDATTGDTQLYTTQFGSAAKISVQSDTAASATSSGFGTTLTSVTGVDIAGTLGGFAATGNGNVLTGNNGGGAQGISIAAGLDTASGSNTTSLTGALGNVTVNDNSLVFQIGANAFQTVKVAVSNVATTALGLNVAGNQFSSLSQIDVQSQSGAQDTIGIIDQAISDITNLRGKLGAIQSQTLDSSANNLQTTLENTTSAESVIRDTDFATETANFSKDQILEQVGTTVLQNANQTSQLVLNLLKNA